MAKCPFCGGGLANKTITYPQEYQGRIYILENVPAGVCSQCGEVLLSPGMVDKVQQLVWSSAEPTRTVETPVYDLAEVT